MAKNTPRIVIDRRPPKHVREFLLMAPVLLAVSVASYGFIYLVTLLLR